MLKNYIEKKLLLSIFKNCHLTPDSNVVKIRVVPGLHLFKFLPLLSSTVGKNFLTLLFSEILVMVFLPMDL